MAGFPVSFANLLKARFPFTYIATWEEERVLGLIRDVARDAALVRTPPDGSCVLDINLASAAAIAALPGLNWEIARKAADLRDSGGPFKSAEDFRYRLGLTMDQLVPLQSLISTLRTPVKSTSPKVKPSGRIVDV